MGMADAHADHDFLRPPRDDEYAPVYRQPSQYNPLHTFQLPTGQDKHYQQQYGDMYFLRLARLKPAAEEVAIGSWDGFSIAGEHARQVERVLDVRQGELCWVAGTMYMDMPLKPNILEDLTKDNFTLAPAPRRTYLDPSTSESTQYMLEDESGRLRLTGSLLRSTQLATGAVIAVLGTENSNGDFEVVDVKVPDLPRQPRRWERDQASSQNGQQTAGNGKIAFVSGLGITGTSSDTLALELLADYLLGYTGTSCSSRSGNDENASPSDASSITRLVIAGNSLGSKMTVAAAPTGTENGAPAKSGTKKYGYDATAYNASPITQLDSFLAEILPSIPVTLMPGESDPANFSLPQQGIHRAMLPQARAYCAPPPSAGEQSPEPGWLDSVSNPWEGDVEGWRLWGCSGQNVDDVLRYLDFLDEDEDSKNGDMESRMKIMESMLRWRCGVPTAPDTIWSYPFQTHDPFVMDACPHIFFAGNQPRFRTTVIEGESPLKFNGGDGDADTDSDAQMTDSMDAASSQRVRLLSLPRFRETGELVLVDTESLEVEVVKFGTFAGKEEKQ